MSSMLEQANSQKQSSDRSTNSPRQPGSCKEETTLEPNSERPPVSPGEPQDGEHRVIPGGQLSDKNSAMPQVDSSKRQPSDKSQPASSSKKSPASKRLGSEVVAIRDQLHTAPKSKQPRRIYAQYDTPLMFNQLPEVLDVPRRFEDEDKELDPNFKRPNTGSVSKEEAKHSKTEKKSAKQAKEPAKDNSLTEQFCPKEDCP